MKETKFASFLFLFANVTVHLSANLRYILIFARIDNQLEIINISNFRV